MHTHCIKLNYFNNLMTLDCKFANTPPCLLPADGSLDSLCIATIRSLAIDMVEAASSGHPGAPIGLAPLAHVLFSEHFNAFGGDLQWLGRDRFVLSNGHACALQYVMLFLLKYPLELSDLKSFRQLHSKTPGHPECHITPGVEITTGPLGQGVANSVGMAIAQSHLAATFNQPGYPIFNNWTFCVVGDGCMQEGVAAEAFSLAGHLKLSRLIVIYDDNGIQIDGSTELAFTENVDLRMKSYGFKIFTVENGNVDLSGISKVISEAKANKEGPSFIRIKTMIGAGSTHQGTEKVHGSPLGSIDAAATKKMYFGKEHPSWYIPCEVVEFYEKVSKKNEAIKSTWFDMFNDYSLKFPLLTSELKRRASGSFQHLKLTDFPTYSPADLPVATRKLSENLLNTIIEKIPELIGGSADLTASNLTRWKSAIDYSSLHPEGRYIRFGVREHAMAAICNGIAAYGHNPDFGSFLLLPMAATFLNFITYAWGAVRLSALSGHQVLYVMTHDSIGLGEDGPTHQPIEVLSALRALPNTLTFRPADGNEVSGAYFRALSYRSGPSILCLSRQNLPQLEGSSAEKVSLGGYCLWRSNNTSINLPTIILVGTGSEVSILTEAVKKLTEICNISIVSMPCMELFEEQTSSYKESIFPKGVPVVSLEASSTFGWAKYATVSIGINSFGASAPASKLYAHFGITSDAVIAAVKSILKK